MAGYGRLDRTTILHAALRLAERPGVTDIRFRDLGAELDADPTAVYRHFRSKKHLLAAAIDHLMNDVLASMPVDAPWRETLQHISVGFLEVFPRYPAIGQHLADVRPVGPAELSLIDKALEAAERAGLSGEALLRRYAALSGFSMAYLAGACRDLLAAGSGGDAGLEAMSWLPEYGHLEEAFPAYARHAPAIAALDFRTTYLTTLDLLLDAITSPLD